MKKTALILIIGMIIGNLTATENELWFKAQKFIENGINLVPGKIIETTIMLNKKGKEKMRTETILKTHKEDDGVSVSFIEGIRGDEKLTEEDKQVKPNLEKDYKPTGETFFDNVTSYQLTSEEVIIDDKNCVVFEYTGEKIRLEGKKKKEKKTFITGKLWIEKSTGVPVMREVSIDPLPKPLKEMKMKIYYTNIDNCCTESRAEAEMLISLLVMKIRMNSITAYSEHWRYNGKIENVLH
ncbi:MAG: hypothetical protein K8S23_00370 [Candidatus Cloacimonetes bacterium]|nr:hypothetical protein [Candidatus Cloacimonadota bacterium]